MTRKPTLFDKLWITDFINLFFPNVCHACGNVLNQQEEVICTSCYFKLPKTGFQKHKENIISEIFWGRIELNAATSFLFFNKGGKVQNLMHALKYKGNKEVGIYLGKLFGEELKQSPLFGSLDFIVPVPLHSKKQFKRGFNQSAVIAQGLGEALEVPVSINNLIRKTHTSTQTKKARYDRWENVKGVFKVENESIFEGKHLLLVDDVLTTGATLEACAHPLLEISNAKVSVVTLAYAQV